MFWSLGFIEFRVEIFVQPTCNLVISPQSLDMVVSRVELLA